MTRQLQLIAALGLAACAVPIWAIYVQFHAVHLPMRAEDDCPYVYGAYALAEVAPTAYGVDCVYR